MRLVPYIIRKRKNSNARGESWFEHSHKRLAHAQVAQVDDETWIKFCIMEHVPCQTSKVFLPPSFGFDLWIYYEKTPQKNFEVKKSRARITTCQGLTQDSTLWTKAFPFQLNNISIYSTKFNNWLVFGCAKWEWW